MLSGLEIKRRVEENDGIYIQDFDVKRLNPNSYNLRLHPTLKVYKDYTLDMKKKNDTIDIEIPESGYKLVPGTLYLGRTIEATATHGLVPNINGRSSMGRLGVGVHVTAGFGDNGFTSDFWTLEITVVQPIFIYPNIEICQIWYAPLEGDPSIEYQGKYQKRRQMASEIYKEFK